MPTKFIPAIGGGGGQSETTGEVTYFLDTLNGDDGNSGLASDAAKKTMEGVLAVIPDRLLHNTLVQIVNGNGGDLSSNVITISKYIAEGVTFEINNPEWLVQDDNGGGGYSVTASDVWYLESTGANFGGFVDAQGYIQRKQGGSWITNPSVPWLHGDGERIYVHTPYITGDEEFRFVIPDAFAEYRWNLYMQGTGRLVLRGIRFSNVVANTYARISFEHCIIGILDAQNCRLSIGGHAAGNPSVSPCIVSCMLRLNNLILEERSAGAAVYAVWSKIDFAGPIYANIDLDHVKCSPDGDMYLYMHKGCADQAFNSIQAGYSTGGHTNWFLFVPNVGVEQAGPLKLSNIDQLRVDLTIDGNNLSSGARFQHCNRIDISGTVSNVNGHGVSLNDSSVRKLISLVGSGNGGAGVYANSGSTVKVDGGVTITGTVGELSTDGVTEAAKWSDIDGGAAVVSLANLVLVAKYSNI